MTEQPSPTYVAQLTLTLPGEGASATVTVTLAPADAVPLGGQTKPLADLTLAELRAYANELEADAWDAYQAITLLQLQEEADVDIEVRPLDKGGQAGAEVEDWLGEAIVLIAPGVSTISAEAAPTDEPPVPDAETETTAPAAPVAEPTTEAAEAPAAAVVEPSPAPQLAHPPSPPAPTQQPALPPADVAAPTIIPSQARVRVAGGRLPLAFSGGAAVDILLDEAPLRAMQAHALSSIDREVAGVMVGRQPEKQPDGRYIVHVIDSIIAKHTVMHGASVTYTPESWRYLNDTLWERYPDESAVMVGWYHTHPGFGIFLSGMDLFIHQNFFTQIWHVAYVLDPRARTSGFFAWNRQRTKVNRYDFIWPEWAAGSW
jgi:proteasome lid subunit RPN8/RPN11